MIPLFNSPLYGDNTNNSETAINAIDKQIELLSSARNVIPLLYELKQKLNEKLVGKYVKLSSLKSFLQISDINIFGYFRMDSIACNEFVYVKYIHLSVEKFYLHIYYENSNLEQSCLSKELEPCMINDKIKSLNLINVIDIDKIDIKDAPTIYVPKMSIKKCNAYYAMRFKRIEELRQSLIDYCEQNEFVSFRDENNMLSYKHKNQDLFIIHIDGKISCTLRHSMFISIKIKSVDELCKIHAFYNILENNIL